MNESTATARYRVGVDVGGTFTDFVLADQVGQRLVYHKQPSVPLDPSEAVLEGLRVLIEREKIDPGDIGLIVHGTTLALNTTIQRKGARAALVVSQGNRDVLEIARCRMPNSYDFRAGKEEPLVPRSRVLELPARLSATGEVVSRPNEAALDDTAARIRALDVEAVAVLLINAPMNAAFEREVVASLQDRLPHVDVTASTTIWSEIREYERGIAATLNATIQPLMSDYLSRLEDKLTEYGIAAPIYVTTSNGGTLSIATARARPIETMLSGPAAGVAAATHIASTGEGEGDGLLGVLSFDMGGTSSDIAISMGGEPGYTNHTHVGDLPLMMPVVDVSAIGAGGGSIVWTDAQGVLKVGPNSAGADPGPISYGRGGTAPTVTDCYLTLGIIDPDRFLGGNQKLDRASAETALREVADRLGITGEDRAARAAEAALLVTSTSMASEMLKALAQKGVDAGELTLMPFGGAGPTHAFMLAEEVEVKNVIVPPAAGTFCALGALTADVKRDFVRSFRRPFADGNGDGDVWEAFTALEQEAMDFIVGEGDILGHHYLQHSAEIRYVGQGFDLSVTVPREVALERDSAKVAEHFHMAHEKTYGFRDTESGLEITTLRVRAVGEVPKLVMPKLAEGKAVPESSGTRSVFVKGVLADVPVYRRDDLGAGHRIAGPFLIDQSDTTVFAMPGWTAVADRNGNLIATRTDRNGATK
ncbi:N-methylhydantoinase A [Roseovarius azorensis]|uniref:N-methylhydantoinase A n=1 Tax=Roseovarius azorensis TaxID=1287727 RepID=A0A1H7XNN2_9RHOB|nr:hydantoinase/oxoprolinase family protein [Roseovarius azorensis]SEM35390.1 N-methylhydantoinase A [Roseovarius azorensis]